MNNNMAEGDRESAYYISVLLKNLKCCSNDLPLWTGEMKDKFESHYLIASSLSLEN